MSHWCSSYWGLIVCVLFCFSDFISGLFPENLEKLTRGRPTTASSKIKVIWSVCWIKRCLSLCRFRSANTFAAGLGGSVGCVVRLETRRSRVQPPPSSATFFRGDWSWNIFYGHSFPSTDSRRAIVSFWRKNVHSTGEPLRGLSLPSKRVVR